MIEPKAYLPWHLLGIEITEGVDPSLFISAIKLFLAQWIFNHVQRDHITDLEGLV